MGPRCPPRSRPARGTCLAPSVAEAAMLDVPIFYATNHGHTRRIAEYMADVLRGHGLASAALEVDSPEAASVDWLGVRAVAIAASLRAGAHQPAAEAFARRHVVE